MVRQREHLARLHRPGRHHAHVQPVALVAGTGVRHAVLGHLSHENNTPELAMSTVCGVLRAHGLELSEDIQVDMAWRDHVGGVYEII